MSWINPVGVTGSFLFLIKIAIHVYIKRKVERKFTIGASGNLLNPILLLPIFDDVPGYLKVLRIAGNFIYVASIILIVIFLVTTNLH